MIMKLEEYMHKGYVSSLITWEGGGGAGPPGFYSTAVEVMKCSMQIRPSCIIKHNRKHTLMPVCGY